MWPDFFFVPRRFANKYQVICSSVFLKNKVSLEIATPAMLTFLDDESNFEHVYGKYLPDKYGSISFDGGRIVWEEYDYKLYFIHPFKLHGDVNQFSRSAFELYIQRYGDEASQCRS
jgi:hypothetical protein